MGNLVEQRSVGTQLQQHWCKTRAPSCLHTFCVWEVNGGHTRMPDLPWEAGHQHEGGREDGTLDTFSHILPASWQMCPHVSERSLYKEYCARSSLWKLLWESLGWSKTRAYLKLIHLNTTLFLIYCHSGSRKPFSAFIQVSSSLSPSIWAPSVEELNITATRKFISWKSTDVWSRVRSVILYLAEEKCSDVIVRWPAFLRMDGNLCFQLCPPLLAAILMQI